MARRRATKNRAGRFARLKRLFWALLLLKLLLFGGMLLFFPGALGEFSHIRQKIAQLFSGKAQEQMEGQAKERGWEERLKERVAEGFSYIQAHGFDEEHAIFIDFSIPSGKERFFVWDYGANQIILQSLVAHGYGSDAFRSTNSAIIFSNEPGSLSSSLGKYRLEGRAPSKWGIKVHYKMYGLEPQNSNAYRRNIVLHSYEEIPQAEIYPQFLPQGFSQGCPVIDNASMKALDQLLQDKKAPVLLWIYHEPLESGAGA